MYVSQTTAKRGSIFYRTDLLYQEFIIINSITLLADYCKSYILIDYFARRFIININYHSTAGLLQILQCTDQLNISFHFWSNSCCLILKELKFSLSWAIRSTSFVRKAEGETCKDVWRLLLYGRQGLERDLSSNICRLQIACNGCRQKLYGINHPLSRFSEYNVKVCVLF